MSKRSQPPPKITIKTEYAFADREAKTKSLCPVCRVGLVDHDTASFVDGLLKGARSDALTDPPPPLDAGAVPTQEKPGDGR